MENGEKTAREQQGVLALETGLGVLEPLIASPRPMMLKDIADNARVHPAKAHRYLVSFARAGYVTQDEDGLYRLGRNAMRLGLSCLAQMDVIAVATSVLDWLRAEVDLPTVASVWTDRGPTVVVSRDSPKNVSVNVKPGTVLPMLTSAAGNVFTAFSDSPEVEHLVRAELESGKIVRDAPRTLSDVEIMKQRVRRQGIAISRRTFHDGTAAIAAPVFTHEGRIVLAIATFGSDRSFDISVKGFIANAVRKAALEISKNLGYELVSA